MPADRPVQVAVVAHRRGQNSFCANCQAVTLGEYCQRCGQRYRRYDRFFLALLSEALEDVLRLDSRTMRTLSALMFRPGFLTTEFFADRRARYLPPVRLFLVASVVMFFFVSVQVPTGPPRAAGDGDNGSDVVSEDTTAPPDLAGNPESATVQTTIDSDFDREDIINQIDELQIPVLSAEDNRALAALLKVKVTRAIKLMEAEPSLLLDQYIDVLAIAMFLLVPLFALFLKVIYLGSHRFYSEHLLFTVNNHSFVFTSLIVLRLFDFAEGTWLDRFAGLAAVAIWGWIAVYLYLGQRRFYGQGHLVTTLKYIVLAACYYMLLFFMMLTTLLWQVMLL
ncbi:MAG: DUF3667 domain-containing protein [Proteobacteria bacterium]|nr:DUF3667 domain-containing protein [Pseudomonadota bacterium]